MSCDKIVRILRKGKKIYINGSCASLKKKKMLIRGRGRGQEITSKPSVQASSPVASYLIRTAARVLTGLTRPRKATSVPSLLALPPPHWQVSSPEGLCLEHSSWRELFSYLLHLLQASSPHHLIGEAFHNHSLEIICPPPPTTTPHSFLCCSTLHLSVCCLLVQYYRNIMKSAASPQHPW